MLLSEGDTEVAVRPAGSDASSAGALDQAALQQVRLVDVFDGVARLTQSDGERAYPNGPTVELVDDQTEVVAVGAVEAKVVYSLHLERSVGGLLVYVAVAHDLGVV